MAGVVKDLPLNPATGAPETVPWATQGTTLAPNAGQISTGWQPYGIGPPPDYRLENYARLTQSDLNLRANQAGLFLEYAFAEVTLAGVAAGANTRQITINATAVQYTDQPGDTLADVYDAFVTLINSSPALNAFVYAVHPAPLSPLEIYATEAGIQQSLAVAVIAGAGTITISVPFTPPITRQAGQPGYLSDVVIGSPQLDDDGDPTHDARVLFDKGKAAFYAGRATGNSWNAVNRGDASINLGTDNLTNVDGAVGIGQGNSVGGEYAFCAGYNNTVATLSDFSIVIGDNSTSSNGYGIAIGSDALSRDDRAVAIGWQASTANSPSGEDALAIGSLANAGATRAVAIGPNAAATGTDSIAIGNTATANALGGIAIGSSASATVRASARGAVALGMPEQDATIATANHSFSHGDACKAEAQHARATGKAAIADNYGEHAQCTLSSAYGAQFGQHQYGRFVAQAQTIGGVSVKLTLDQINGTGNDWAPRTNRSYLINLMCIASTNAGQYAAWNTSGIVTCSGGVASVVVAPGTAPTQNSGANSNTLTLTTSASGGAIQFTGAGHAGDTYFWTLTVQYSEVRRS